MSRYRRRGAVYLVCWAATPYFHAGHYLGFAYPADPDSADPAILAEVMAAMQTRVTNRWLTAAQAAGVANRIAGHRAGDGARLLAVITAAGIEFEIARIWPSAIEGHEKALKDRNNGARLCPLCHPGTQAGTTVTPKQYRRRRRVPAVAALAA